MSDDYTSPSELIAYANANERRRYRYTNPSSSYRPRKGRNRAKYSPSNRLHRHWLGGALHAELMALARYEGLYATPSELAKLHAYAADWDSMAACAADDAIPF